MNLIGSLGLDAVESDPNALPDGKWPGEIFKSEYIWHKEKNSGNEDKTDVSHVITYRVTDGDRKGATRQEWWLVGRKNPTNPEQVVGVMSEQQKPWYKARLEALGVEDFNNFQPEQIVGKKVTFGTKKNGNFININFVELRQDQPVASMGDSTPVNILGGI